MRLSMQVLYAATADGFARTAKQLSTLEQAGLDVAWVAEAYGFDAPSLMGYLAATTERLEIGSGILPIYTRTPALLPLTAARVDPLSGVPCILRLRASSPPGLVGAHRPPYPAP